jgi:hypothetical protein
MRDEELEGFYDAPTPPDAWLRDAERRELLRLAAVNALKHGGKLHPDARRWAEHWSSIPPLGRPLSTGEPAPEAQP